MSITLADALKDIELEAGETYRFEVGGRVVELRVLSGRHASSDTMLEPWTEFPFPEPRFRIRARLGTLPIDVPDIPQLNGDR
jgi:hypothetical protein